MDPGGASSLSLHMHVLFAAARSIGQTVHQPVVQYMTYFKEKIILPQEGNFSNFVAQKPVLAKQKKVKSDLQNILRYLFLSEKCNYCGHVKV